MRTCNARRSLSWKPRLGRKPGGGAEPGVPGSITNTLVAPAHALTACGLCVRGLHCFTTCIFILCVVTPDVCQKKNKHGHSQWRAPFTAQCAALRGVGCAADELTQHAAHQAARHIAAIGRGSGQGFWRGVQHDVVYFERSQR